VLIRVEVQSGLAQVVGEGKETEVKEMGSTVDEEGAAGSVGLGDGRTGDEAGVEVGVDFGVSQR
jgi:hypothetical protein